MIKTTVPWPEDRPWLAIPGPTRVRPDILQACARPSRGHRGRDFAEHYLGLQAGLQQLFGVTEPVFVSTSSATAVMEAAVRNLSRQGVLCMSNGAFSERWADLAEANGHPVIRCAQPWGEAITADILSQAIEEHRGNIDLVTLVHNETSTGVMNPLKELAAVMRSYPDILWAVDTVSSCAAVELQVAEWGIDCCLTGSQKALSLPPGMALFTLSDRAWQRAKEVENRGYYLDFLKVKAAHDKDSTLTTPAMPQMHALEARLTDIAQEGWPQRLQRHQRMAEQVRQWAQHHGGLFANEAYASVSLTCVANRQHKDIPKLQALMADRGVQLDGGYGAIKGKTFRISHMGDTYPEDCESLLALLDDCWTMV